MDKSAVSHVAITGGDKRRVNGNVLGVVPVRFVDELQAIAAGAHHLSGRNEAVAVSCGTGTAVVYYSVEGGLQTLHLGGTAVGGGTLEGLSNLLLQKPVEEIEALAKGASGLDLTVGDVVGGGIGVVPADATAAHFAKATTGAKPQDVAQSLLCMVAESIATVASLAGDKIGCNDLVFCGRVAQNQIVQERVGFACRIYGKTPYFPKNGQYATAIGAAIRSL